jgi:hypothetical protein
MDFISKKTENLINEFIKYMKTNSVKMNYLDNKYSAKRYKIIVNEFLTLYPLSVFKLKKINNDIIIQFIITELFLNKNRLFNISKVSLVLGHFINFAYETKKIKKNFDIIIPFKKSDILNCFTISDFLDFIAFDDNNYYKNLWLFVLHSNIAFEIALKIDWKHCKIDGEKKILFIEIPQKIKQTFSIKLDSIAYRMMGELKDFGLVFPFKRQDVENHFSENIKKAGLAPCKYIINNLQYSFLIWNLSLQYRFDFPKTRLISENNQ